MSAPILLVRTACSPGYVSGHSRRSGTGADAVVHAVAVHRDPAELLAEPELAVCGAIVLVDAEAPTGACTAAPSCPECQLVTGALLRRR
ncbi:hypothetical protein GB931_19540 [Modestobacter sp. I12A-02628]|uniref:Uncharacterized protein n=1 Tax=Goekera deserti TaxID=2497753 RepID=A0A7K3WI84_9ACTN|nr:hypothetical protein [Goekera deserti]MPR00072.1 hypothetical protein [Goekera deserti]NDI49851.1 hypothetical protein [Goekera deserti]NEL55213.1 hypothetical protein [Goekera deserti]